MKKIINIVFLIIILFTLVGCKQSNKDEIIEITTSNYDQYLGFYDYVIGVGDGIEDYFGYILAHYSAECEYTVYLKEGYEVVENIIIEFKIIQPYTSATFYSDGVIKSTRRSSFQCYGTWFIDNINTSDKYLEIVKLAEPYFGSGDYDKTIKIISITGQIKEIKGEQNE